MRNPRQKKPKRKKKHPPVGIPIRVQRKIDKSANKTRQRKFEADLRQRVTIKTLQGGGRIVATIDPATGKVLKREKNPRYVAEDKEFRKISRKKKRAG